MKRSNGIALWAFTLMYGMGCSDGKSHSVPWGDDDTASVIDPDREIKSYTVSDADGCVGPDVVGCVKLRDECAAGAEVVLGLDGKALETICYPKGDTLSVDTIASQAGNVKQNQNNAVIALDAVDDGADIHGDLSVDANNVVVYGDDPATSVIDGDVDVDGNNIIVRGVTIEGDVEIQANNAVFVHCVIEGNVVVYGNNAVIAACDVFGSIELHGNNTKLAGNHVVGSVSDAGKNTSCQENVRATDTNENGALESSELGAALSCGR